MNRHLIIPTLILTILTSCNYINTDKKRSDKVESYKEFFYINQKTFDQLTEELLTNEKINSKIGQLLTAEDVDELTNIKLRRLEIESFSISQTKCGKLEIEYKTTWTKYPIGQMYLSKDSCLDDPLTVKGNHSKDSSFIETWGLGDGWVIWIDSDPI